MPHKCEQNANKIENLLNVFHVLTYINPNFNYYIKGVIEIVVIIA